MLVSGRNVRNLVFRNVSLTVAVMGNTSCSKGDGTPPHGCRDYRPRDPENTSVIACNTSAIYFEGSGGASFEHSTVRFEEPRGQPVPQYWDSGAPCAIASTAWAVGGIECARGEP